MACDSFPLTIIFLSFRIVCLQYLQDLINKQSNIIIADIYDEQALMVLCEAYKLEVCAPQIYINSFDAFHLEMTESTGIDALISPLLSDCR